MNTFNGWCLSKAMKALRGARLPLAQIPEYL